MATIHRERPNTKGDSRTKRPPQRTCLVCNKKFKPFGDFVGRTQKYCSKECWNIRGRVVNKCLECGAEVITYKSINKKTCSIECLKKQRQKPRKNQIKENASYSAIHKYLTVTYGKPEQCKECGLKPNNKADIHWANMTGEYTREKKDYKPLCRWCHLKHDGNDIKSNGGRWGKVV
jgi:hypothetical protein